MFDNFIFTGTVRHRRYIKKLHQFSYKVFMFCFDINNIDTTFKNIAGLSVEQFNHYSFYSKNYLSKKSDVPLDQFARQLVQEKYGTYPEGKIFLLTNLSCFGYCFNPISLYFIFNKDVTDLDFVIVEVTNTPWGERHSYVLANPERPKAGIYRYQFKKELHVSPFLEMNYVYLLNLKLTKQKIIVHIENYQNDDKHFDATLVLENADAAPEKILKKYPLMTFKVALAIYWQALKLWLKGVSFHTHPSKSKG